MERVPYEVRIRIFNWLTYKDKLTCSLVSKDWQRLIKPYLFTDFKIQDDQNLTSAISYFEKHPEIAINVQQIITKRCTDASLYLPRIQQLFPKLSKFDYSSFTIHQPENTSTLGPWNSLKELIITEPLTVRESTMLQLFLTNHCPNLTTLSICNLIVCWSTLPDHSENRFPGFVNLLQNAPQLSRLEISSLKCALLDLELIHEKAPKLNSLKLSAMKFVERTGPIINSNTEVQLDDLCVRFTSANEDDYAFNFSYIAKKYSDLISFSVTMQDKYHDIVFEDFPIIRNDLFHRNPQLKYFDQNFFLLTPDIMDIMDLCGIQLDGIKLYINPNDAEYQCDALFNSNQRLSLKHVSIYLRYTEWEDSEMRESQALAYALESVADLPNLTDLAIESVNRTCISQFTSFLNTVPEVSKISVRHATVMCIEEDVQEVENYLPLKKIEIHDLDIKSVDDREVVNVVLQEVLSSCPHLEEFVLDMYLPEVPDDELKSVTLDFRECPKLKSIVVNANDDRNQYRIIQKAPASGGYYLYDEEKKLFEKIEALDPDEYYTTIILSRPVMLNSCQV